MSEHIPPSAADELRMHPWRRNDPSLQARARKEQAHAAEDAAREAADQRHVDRQMRALGDEEYPGQYSGSSGWGPYE